MPVVLNEKRVIKADFESEVKNLIFLETFFECVMIDYVKNLLLLGSFIMKQQVRKL
jgi:hypothetical protein